MVQNEESILNSETTAMETPGKILRKAREALAFSQAQIAEKMNLSVQLVKEIEADNYRRFAAPIYIRGYLRSFAQLVGVAEEHVLRAFEALDINKEFNLIERQVSAQFKDHLVLPVYRHKTPLKKKLLRWMTLIMLCILVGLVVLWWQGQQHHLHSAISPDTLTKEPTIVATHDEKNDHPNNSAINAVNPVTPQTVAPIQKVVTESNMTKINSVAGTSANSTPLSNHQSSPTNSPKSISPNSSAKTHKLKITPAKAPANKVILNPNYTVEPAQN